MFRYHNTGRRALMKTLCLHEDVIKQLPNRKNNVQSAKKYHRYEEFTTLVTSESSAPKTIVFCQTYKEAALILLGVLFLCQGNVKYPPQWRIQSYHHYRPKFELWSPLVWAPDSAARIRKRVLCSTAVRKMFWSELCLTRSCNWLWPAVFGGSSVVNHLSQMKSTNVQGLQALKNITTSVRLEQLKETKWLSHFSHQNFIMLWVSLSILLPKCAGFLQLVGKHLMVP